MKWILASASPRRRELLASLGLHFDVVPSGAEELHDHARPMASLCEANAAAKARDVSLLHPDAVVIGADTLVGLEGKLFGKPADAGEARRMLAELSGRTHEVITGVCLAHRGRGREEIFSDRTLVTFRELDSAAIAEYLAAAHVLDKAGAYGIQERGELLVERIAGSFSNVMGFPVERFQERLKDWK
jgi:septum formation protein